MRSTFLAMAVFAVLCVSSVLPAQTTQSAGTLSGKVTDEQHAPLANVTVSVIEAARSAITDAQGRFDFGTLPAGLYHISARRLGYRTT